MVNVLTHCRPVDRKKCFLLRPNNTLTDILSFWKTLPVAQPVLSPVTFLLTNDRLTVFSAPWLLACYYCHCLSFCCIRVRLGPLICEELLLGFPTGKLVCVYSSIRMPPFHKFDMPFCCHGKPSLKIYIFAFGLDGFLSQWFKACCPQGQI